MFVEVSLLDGSSAYLPAELVYLSRPRPISRPLRRD